MSDVGQDQKDQEYVDQEQKEPEYTDDHNEFVSSFPLDLSQWKNFYFVMLIILEHFYHTFWENTPATY